MSDYDKSIVQEGLEKSKLQDKLDLKKEFKVISYPQVPLKASSPKILLNILIALILGFFLSLFVVIIKPGK